MKGTAFVEEEDEENNEEEEEYDYEDITYNEIFAADENEQQQDQYHDPVAQWVPMEDEEGAQKVTLTRQDYEDSQSVYSLKLLCSFLCTASYTLHGETPLAPSKKIKKFHV